MRAKVLLVLVLAVALIAGVSLMSCSESFGGKYDGEIEGTDVNYKQPADSCRQLILEYEYDNIVHKKIFFDKNDDNDFFSKVWNDYYIHIIGNDTLRCTRDEVIVTENWPGNVPSSPEEIAADITNEFNEWRDKVFAQYDPQYDQ